MVTYWFNADSFGSSSKEAALFNSHSLQYRTMTPISQERKLRDLPKATYHQQGRARLLIMVLSLGRVYCLLGHRCH